MSYQSEKTGVKVDELLDKIDALENATTSQDGLMSSEDKTFLDSISQKFNDGIAKTDLASSVQSSLDLADTALQSFTETDPTVPSWAKTSSKPTYTASEVGALPDSTVIPDVTGKADKVDSATSGNFASLDANGNLTDSGHKHSDYLTSHQDISNYVQKSNTSGLLKNDGTVDTNTYVTAATAPVTSVNSQTGAVTLALGDTNVIETVKVNGSALTPDANKAVDITVPSVSGKEDTTNKVTSLSSSSTDTQYPSAKCVFNLIGDIETLLAAL